MYHFLNLQRILDKCITWIRDLKGMVKPPTDNKPVSTD